MRITRRGAFRSHGTVSIAHVDLVSSEGGTLPRAGVRVTGKGSSVSCTVWGLLGVAQDEKTMHRYFVELSIPELAQIVRAVMKTAPSAELMEAVSDGAIAALPRRSRKKR